MSKFKIKNTIYHGTIKMRKNYQASSEKAMPIFIHRDKKKIKNFLKLGD